MSEVMQWRPIETAPKNGSWFLAWVHDSQMVWGGYELASWEEPKDGRPGYVCEQDTSEELEGATHWMPLPPPPDEI